MRLISLILCVLIGTAQAGDNKQDFKIGDRLPATQPSSTTHTFREITWDDLVPRDWNPEKELSDINWDELSDEDPRAQKALEKLRAVWDSAPAEKSLEGAKVRLAGFVVPLEYKGDDIHEFLLVPYFGACIHTPPPPANQIVHVYGNQMPKGVSPMDPFWISGTLKIDHALTDMGFSSYQMTMEKAEPYLAKNTQQK